MRLGRERERHRLRRTRKRQPRQPVEYDKARQGKTRQGANCKKMWTKSQRNTHEVEVSEVIVGGRRHDDVPEVDDLVVPHVSEDEHLPVDALRVHLPRAPNITQKHAQHTHV